MKRSHLLLLLLTCCARCGQCRTKQASLLPHACSTLSPHIEFKDPSTYNPNNPPTLPVNGGNSTSVILVQSQHRVMDVTEVSDTKRTVSLQLVSYKMWTDHRVKVNYSKHVSNYIES